MKEATRKCYIYKQEGENIIFHRTIYKPLFSQKLSFARRYVSGRRCVGVMSAIESVTVVCPIQLRSNCHIDCDSEIQ
jgi:hypothetical protein